MLFLVLMVGEGLSKCCGVAMHCKYSWNNQGTKNAGTRGGWWCTNTRHKGIALGHFLKAKPLSFSNTQIGSQWPLYKATTALRSRKWFLPLPWLGVHQDEWIHCVMVFTLVSQNPNASIPLLLRYNMLLYWHNS